MKGNVEEGECKIQLEEKREENRVETGATESVLGWGPCKEAHINLKAGNPVN